MIKKRVSIKKILALLVLFPSLSADQLSTDPKKTTIVKHGEDDHTQKLEKLVKSLLKLKKDGIEGHIIVKDGNMSISIKYGQDCQYHVTYKTLVIATGLTFLMGWLVGFESGRSGRGGRRR